MSIRGSSRRCDQRLQPRASLARTADRADPRRRRPADRRRADAPEIPISSFGVHGLAVEPLLQDVERLHAAVAHDQQFAVDGAVEAQRLGQIGKAAGRCPRRCASRAAPSRGRPVVRAGDRLHADAVPLPLGHEVGRIERGELAVLEGVREHGGAERRRIAADSGSRRGLPARRTARDRAAEARATAFRSRPASLPPSEAAAVLARRAETPMRRAPVTSLSSAQRPVSSSASSQRASCAGSCVLPSVDSVSITSRQRAATAFGLCVAGLRRGHISATVSERSPT